MRYGVGVSVKEGLLGVNSWGWEFLVLGMGWGLISILAFLDSIAEAFAEEGEENVFEIMEKTPVGDHLGIDCCQELRGRHVYFLDLC